MLPDYDEFSSAHRLSEEKKQLWDEYVANPQPSTQNFGY